LLVARVPVIFSVFDILALDDEPTISLSYLQRRVLLITLSLACEHVRVPRTGRTSPGFTSPVGTPCTTVELVGVGLDRGLPLSPTGIRARCGLNTDSTAVGWFTGAVWV
jgi:hypothetical protein